MSTNLLALIISATGETLYMVIAASLLATLVGLPIGLLLFVTNPKSLKPQCSFNKILSVIINAMRSVPFIILMVAIIPFTRLVTGTSIGTTAAIVPLTVAAFPFVARVVENALQEVPHGLIEAGLSMGANTTQILNRILLPESLPALVNGLTLMIINLVGYSAMAGAVGGGGLGDLAIRYGYERFNWQVMLITVVLLILLVQFIQSLGNWFVRKLDKRKIQ